MIYKSTARMGGNRLPYHGQRHRAVRPGEQGPRAPGRPIKILVLTYHHPPDLGASSFRMAALERALQEIGGSAVHVDVITTMPNRYHSLALHAPAVEDLPGLRIRRLPLPIYWSGKLRQSVGFAAFARQALRETRDERWDLVFATSSRLMTAVLAARIAGRAGAPLYLDIRDLFTDTMTDLMAGRSTRWLLRGVRKLEAWALRRAARINLVSPAFLGSVKASAPDADYRFFSNGASPGFEDFDFRSPETGGRGPALVVYAGNIGDGQGLERIVPAAARLLDGEARFRLIGDGSRRRHLERALAEQGASNVEILDPVPQHALRAHYREADALFLHLNDHPIFKTVLPSKTYEYAVTGKPLLAGVGGFAAEFLEGEVEGVEVFFPCDAEGLAAGFRRLRGRARMFDRRAFQAKFALDDIMREMAEDILDLVGLDAAERAIRPRPGGRAMSAGPAARAASPAD